MNKLLEAAEAVLVLIDSYYPMTGYNDVNKVNALRQAAAEAKQGCEPVAWLCTDTDSGNVFAATNEHQLEIYTRAGRKIEPLYTTPPSIDALIAEIDELSPAHVNDEYRCKHSDTLIMYHACDIKAILAKYRSVK